MFFAQFWISELLVFVPFFFFSLSSRECMFLLEITDGGRQRRPRDAEIEGVGFYFSILKKKVKQNKNKNTKKWRGQSTVCFGSFCLRFLCIWCLCSGLRKRAQWYDGQKTRSGQREISTWAYKSNRLAFIYLIGWKEERRAPRPASHQLSLNPHFCCCPAVGSASMPLSSAVHLRTTKPTNVLNICSQSAIIILYTCEKI